MMRDVAVIAVSRDVGASVTVMKAPGATVRTVAWDMKVWTRIGCRKTVGLMMTSTMEAAWPETSGANKAPKTKLKSMIDGRKTKSKVFGKRKRATAFKNSYCEEWKFQRPAR